jgi:DNA end-binding protein Ku
MARSIWKGSIRFGLVTIPVGLYPADKSAELHFNLLDRRNLAPIHYQRINSETGKEVPWEQTVRGYEFEPDRYIVLSDEDLKRANPEGTQTVDIVDFVDLAEISPIYFEKPYYLAPERQGAKSYALLRETLRRTGKAGIAKVVIRTRQHLAALLPVGKALALDLMRFEDELRDPAELDLPGGKQGVTEKELQMAERLVGAMVDGWDPGSYRDDFRADVKALIDRRVAAGQLAAGPSEPAPRRPERGGKVIDLMSLLKRSVEAGGRRGAGAAAAAARTARPARPGHQAPARAAKARPAAARRRSSSRDARRSA